MFKNKLPLAFKLYKPSFSALPVKQALQLKLSSNLFSAKSLIPSALLVSYLTAHYHYSKLSTTEDLREVEVGKVGDLKEGEMKPVQVGPAKEDVILLAKYQEKYYAVGNACSHYGAPLNTGVIFEDKVYCPWHCAAFSIQTGTPEMGPVFDGIPTYQLREENGTLFVKVPKQLNKPVTSPPLAHKSKTDYRKFVILGAGPAALSAAQTLRQSGYQGEIILVTNDSELPFDRTALSKNVFGADINKLYLRDASFYEQNGITVLTNSNVKYVNIDKDEVEIEGRDKIKYDRLLIATGGRPRVPQVAGVGLKNVFTLRTFKDAENIKNNAKAAKKIVVIGASFIGLETASSIKKELKDKVEIVVVDAAKAPFQRVLGEEVGNSLKKLHEDNGIKFLMEKSLKSLEGAGEVKQVVFADGSHLDADAVILGTGIQPNTELVSKSLRIAPDGGIFADVFLKTARENIYCAGDVCSFPYWYTGSRARVEHYNEAIQQGSIAAFNMLDKKVPHDSIPFFWTRHWDKSLHYVGYAPEFNDVYVEGSLKDLNFVAYYIKDDHILAAAAMNKSPIPMVLNQAMQLNVMPTATELKAGKVTLEDIKKRIQAKKGACKCKKDDCCKTDYHNLKKAEAH